MTSYFHMILLGGALDSENIPLPAVFGELNDTDQLKLKPKQKQKPNRTKPKLN